MDFGNIFKILPVLFYQHFTVGAVEGEGEGVVAVFKEKSASVFTFLFAEADLVADAVFAAHQDGVFRRGLFECGLYIAEAKFRIDFL